LKTGGIQTPQIHNHVVKQSSADDWSCDERTDAADNAPDRNLDRLPKPENKGRDHLQKMGIESAGIAREDPGHGKSNDPVLHQIDALMLGHDRIEGSPVKRPSQAALADPPENQCGDGHQTDHEVKIWRQTCVEIDQFMPPQDDGWWGGRDDSAAPPGDRFPFQSDNPDDFTHSQRDNGEIDAADTQDNHANEEGNQSRNQSRNEKAGPEGQPHLSREDGGCIAAQGHEYRLSQTPLPGAQNQGESHGGYRPETGQDDRRDNHHTLGEDGDQKDQDDEKPNDGLGNNILIIERNLFKIMIHFADAPNNPCGLTSRIKITRPKSKTSDK